jgi:hypothetical protein
MDLSQDEADYSNDLALLCATTFLKLWVVRVSLTSVADHALGFYCTSNPKSDTLIIPSLR